MNHVRIKSDGTPENTYVTIDGTRMDNIVSVEFELGVADHVRRRQNGIATITMRVYVDDLDVEGGMTATASKRTVARMTDVETLERAMVLLGEAGIEKVMLYAAELCAGAIQAFKEPT